MKIVEDMSYRQWQKRNTNRFKSLTKTQQKEARQQGYCNQSWHKVQISWKLVFKLADNIISLFEHKLNNGDILGAIELSVLEAKRAKNLARQAIDSLNNNKEKLDKLADEASAKYLPL